MFRKLIGKLFGGGVVTDDAAVPRPVSTKTSAERRELPPLLVLPDDPAERLKVLLLNDRKIEAIKTYREMTGMSLADAKADMDALYLELQQSGAVAEMHKRPNISANAQMEQVYALIEAGNKIGAIKLYREMTGLGLAESKEAVEALERGERPSSAGNIDAMNEVRALLILGKRVEAIQLYRKMTGESELAAKEAIAKIEESQREPTLETVMPKILEHLHKNQKINAIKLYREVTGVGLKEAKDAVDEMERQL